jgi:hypothetical protein
MMRCSLLVVGLSLLPGTGRAGEAYFSKVHDVDKGTASLVFRGLECIDVLKQVVNERTGEKVEVHVPTPFERNWKYSLNDYQVYDGIGKLLGPEEVLKRVHPGMVVLIARKGDKINLGKLFSLKKETLILIMPPNKNLPPAALSPNGPLGFLGETIVEEASSLGQRIAVGFFDE